MRRVAWLFVMAGCDAVFGIQHLNPAAPDASARCAHGTPFPRGDLLDMGASVGVEALRMNAGETQAFLALVPVPATGPVDTANTDLYFAPVVAGVIGGHSMFGGINSTAYDSYPTLTADGQHLIYGSKRSGVQRLNVATAVAGSFDNPTFSILDLVSGATSNEPYALASGEVLYFQADQAGADLFRADGGPTSYGNVTRLDSLDTADRDDAPVVTDDELEIFFGSDRANPGRSNLSGLDIYTSVRESPAEPFAAPTVVTELSTVDETDYPVWISPDACTLYYISKQGTRGMLYVARR